MVIWQVFFGEKHRERLVFFARLRLHSRSRYRQLNDRPGQIQAHLPELRHDMSGTAARSGHGDETQRADRESVLRSQYIASADNVVRPLQYCTIRRRHRNQTGKHDKQHSQPLRYGHGELRTRSSPMATLAAGEGFEPSHTESESAVLPLHNPAVF